MEIVQEGKCVNVEEGKFCFQNTEKPIGEKTDNNLTNIILISVITIITLILIGITIWFFTRKREINSLV